jgi:hypothetical protein
MSPTTTEMMIHVMYRHFPISFSFFFSFFLIQLHSILLRFLGKNSTSYTENGHVSFFFFFLSYSIILTIRLIDFLGKKLEESPQEWAPHAPGDEQRKKQEGWSREQIATGGDSAQRPIWSRYAPHPSFTCRLTLTTPRAQ